MGATAVAIAGLALTAVSTGVGMIGSINQGNQAKQLADAQAEQGRIQGELAELNARAEADNIQNEALNLRARQVAQGANAGLSLDSGSFMAIAADSAKQAEDDRQQVLRTGRLNRAAAEAGAQAISFAGSSKRSAGLVNAGATFFNGASSAMGIADKAKWFD